MTKMIKITSDYWGDGESVHYIKFSRENMENVIADYTEDTPETEGYEDFLDGKVGSGRYEEIEDRNWDGPSGYYIDITTSGLEVFLLEEQLNEEIVKLKEM